MYKKSQFIKNVYKPKDVMELLNVTHRTLYNYDEQGKLKFSRSESGRRIIFRDDLLQYLDDKGLLIDDSEAEKRDYIYARVSSQKQSTTGDLDRQAMFLIENVNNLQSPVVLKEVGSGLNDKRPKLLKLMDDVMDGKVNNIYVTYKDRLTRFGFNYLERICNHHGVRIIVVKDIARTKSIEQELAEDLISMSAKEKLDKIVEYLGSHKEISKKEIMDIICEDEDIDFMV